MDIYIYIYARFVYIAKISRPGPCVRRSQCGRICIRFYTQSSGNKQYLVKWCFTVVQNHRFIEIDTSWKPVCNFLWVANKPLSHFSPFLRYCNGNFRYRRFTYFFFSFTPYSCWSIAVSSIILCRHSPRVNGSHEAEVQRAQVCLNWTEQSVVQYPLVSFSVTQLYNLVSKNSPSATRL